MTRDQIVTRLQEAECEASFVRRAVAMVADAIDATEEAERACREARLEIPPLASALDFLRIARVCADRAALGAETTRDTLRARLAELDGRPAP